MGEDIKVLQCPQCGATAKLNINKCEYCGSEFIVTNLAYLDKFDKTGINKYINHYKQLLKVTPDNGEYNCAMGICYLDLKLFDLATKYFAIAIEQMPDNSDAYYYYAIALLKGRRPKILTLKEIEKIESYLSAATQIDSNKSKYFYLLALIKYDFYIANGLRINPPTFEELISEGNSKPFEKQENEKMLQRVPVGDTQILSLLRR